MSEPVILSSMVKMAAEYLASFAEAAAAFVIIVGALQALWIYVRRNLRSTDLRELAAGRIRLGHSLVFGLELLIAADILKTAVAPTWQDIWQLAAIIGIRTVLNLFLIWELDEADRDLLRRRRSQQPKSTED